MKFTINAKTFANALTQQLRVINAKNTLIILDNFKIEAVGTGHLIITASDQEITSHVTIEAEVQETGTLCLNARELTDIVRKLGDKSITFSTEGNLATITCGKGIYTLPVISADEYPKRELPKEGFFTLPTTVIIEGFSATKGALSSDTIRPTLTGVHMNILPENKGIDFVGTDTHQLVVCHSDSNGISPFGIIIPAKTVNLVLNMFAKYPELQICVTERTITFRTEDEILMSGLILGAYPNYNRVMPQTSPYKIKVNKKELLDVINRVSGFASNSTNLLVLEDSGMMELKVSGKDWDFQRSAEDYIMAEGTMNGIKIGMSSEYLTRVLNIFSGDDITLQVADAARPLLIEEGGLKAIIMPIQITD